MSPPTIAVPARPRPLQIGLRRPAESPLATLGPRLPVRTCRRAKGGAGWGECRADAQSWQRSPRPQGSPRPSAAFRPMPRRRRSGAPSHQLISRTPCPIIEKYRTAGADMLFVLLRGRTGSGPHITRTNGERGTIFMAVVRCARTNGESGATFMVVVCWR